MNGNVVSTNSDYADAAILFIKEYLSTIYSRLSIFSKRDRFLFPEFTRNPQRVVVCVSSHNGLMIEARRESKEWLFTKKITNLRLELFADYPFTSVNLFKIDNARRVQISNLAIQFEPVSKFRNFSGGTILNVKEGMGFVQLEDTSDVRLVDINLLYIENLNKKTIQKYKKIRFVWLMKYATEPNLSLEEARMLAAEYSTNIIFNLAFDIELGKITKDGINKILKILTEARNEYLNIIQRVDVEELEIQNYLENKYFIIDYKARSLKKPKKIGELYIPDFILQYDGAYRLVEIERPHDAIIKGNEFSPRAKHAISQVRDWLNLLHGTKGCIYVEGEPRKPHYVIIGMVSNLDPKELECLGLLNAKLDDIQVLGFDQIIANYNQRINEILSIQ